MTFFKFQVSVRCLLSRISLDIILFPLFEIGHIYQILYRQWRLWYACCQIMESK